MNECSFGQEEPKKEAGPRATGIRSGNEDAVNSVCEPQPETNPRHSDPKSINSFGKSAISGHSFVNKLKSKTYNIFLINQNSRKWYFTEICRQYMPYPYISFNY